ncbi:MAG TPA: OsmC family peroxiredoxin [Dongiaceae bacterium]|nr:OsmC family peroxiredoxin [Dongiaceae bacterium]
MLREAHAVWKDGPYAGEGALSTPSGILNNTRYSFGSLTNLVSATSPAEMLAAAISSCISRMVAMEMAKVGIKPIQVETNTALTIDYVGQALRILGAQLKIIARTNESDHGKFDEAVETAQRECPICGVLNMDIHCEAKLVSLTAPALV